MLCLFIRMKVGRKMDSVSFGSDIKIIPISKFRKDFINSNEFIDALQDNPPVIGNKVKTSGLACCIGGALKNDETASAFHFHWYNFYINMVNKTMNSMKKTKFKGFLTGGYEEKKYYPETTSSSFQRFFQCRGIDFSIIADRIGGWDTLSKVTHFSYSKDDDIYNLGVEDVNKVISIETPEDLVKTFKIIYLSDNDRLFLDNTEVHRIELKKALKYRDQNRL